LNLGAMGGAAAVTALESGLEDPNSRIRRAVAIGLGSAGGEASAKALEKAITSDSAEEVIGAAAIALEKMGELHHADDLDFLREYAATDLDPNLQKAARDAAETIAGFVNVKTLQSR
jgi:HEAT repeat protein